MNYCSDDTREGGWWCFLSLAKRLVCLPGGLLYRSTASILRELLFFCCSQRFAPCLVLISVDSSMVTSRSSPSSAGLAAGDGRDPLDDLIREFTAASTAASPASAAPL
jgi:hypothetical protein